VRGADLGLSGVARIAKLMQREFPLTKLSEACRPRASDSFVLILSASVRRSIDIEPRGVPERQLRAIQAELQSALNPDCAHSEFAGENTLLRDSAASVIRSLFACDSYSGCFVAVCARGHWRLAK
jgi:hypothetical protein